MLSAKLMDDLLIGEKVLEVNKFMGKAKQRFTVAKAIIVSKI